MNPYHSLTHPFFIHLTLWGFCMMFMLPLKHRQRFILRVCVAFTLVLFSGAVSLFYPLNKSWQEVLGYSIGLFFFVFFCCETNFFQGCYGATWILITHQLTMECWAIFYIFVHRVNDLGSYFIMIGLFFYTLVCWGLGLTICRWLPQNGAYRIGPRQFAWAVVLLVIFEVNYCLLFFDRSFPDDILMMVALLPAQFYCVCTLYFQNALFRKSDLQREVDMLNRLRHEQQIQYDLAKENIAIINRKCHDLKHQMSAMRSMVPPEHHEKYLSEIERSVRIYDSILKTGNEVLDTVLTEKSLLCEANHITIHCVADGSRLDFMDPVDLYTVFGNALDNAIECVQTQQAAERRMIDVLICTEKNCLVVQILNPLDEGLTFVDGLPLTTKGDTEYHGYGLKSIRHTVRQYGGHMNVKVDNGWFSLKILIPLTEIIP